MAILLSPTKNDDVHVAWTLNKVVQTCNVETVYSHFVCNTCLYLNPKVSHYRNLSTKVILNSKNVYRLFNCKILFFILSIRQIYLKKLLDSNVLKYKHQVKFIPNIDSNALFYKNRIKCFIKFLLFLSYKHCIIFI